VITVALKGKKPKECSGSQPVESAQSNPEVDRILKEDMGTIASNLLLGGCVEGLEDVETSKAWRNQCASYLSRVKTLEGRKRQEGLFKLVTT
jgi:hypothetical protein